MSPASMPNSCFTSFEKSAMKLPFASCIPGKSALARICTPLGITFVLRKFNTLLVYPGTVLSTRMFLGNTSTL